MTFDEQLRRAFDTLADRLREHIAGELRGAAADLAASAQSDREAAVATASAEAREAAQEDARKSLDAAVASERADLKTAALATSARLLEAIRAIDRAHSLTEILDVLVSCAGREASRVGILLVRAGQLRGWRFIGFGPAFDAANEIELPLHDSGLIAEAVRTGAAVSSDTSGRTAAPAFADLPDGREALAAPIPMGGQVVGILYADQGHTDDPSRASAITWPDTLEVMARHSARCLEALTAFRAARVLTERPDVPPGTASDQPDLAGSRGNGRAEEDPEDGSESARRYARLLVSEIKLYHEATVIAGRRERDLATRLGAEIARARLLYEQRVPAPVREGTDHFQAELVRTLANGDANLLGQTT
jgi:hypothetical protein